MTAAGHNLSGFLYFLSIAASLVASPARSLRRTALPPAHELSVSRGLDFLATQQNADGSFGTIQKPLLTGLALSSFLAKGHTSDVGRFAQQSARLSIFSSTPPSPTAPSNKPSSRCKARPPPRSPLRKRLASRAMTTRAAG